MSLEQLFDLDFLLRLLAFLFTFPLRLLGVDFDFGIR